jgi:hypothetical protein
MRNIGLITLAVVIGSATAARAQTNSDAAAAPVHVTIVGCVAPADQTVGTTGTTGSASNASYKLTNARETTKTKVKANKNKAKVKTTKEVKASPSNESNQTYELSGNEPAVAAQVGHIIEIDAVEAQAPPGASAPTSSSGTPLMVVEEVRLVSPTCQ